MLQHLEVFRLAEEHLIRIGARLEEACARGAGVHLRHLLGHLVGGWREEH